MPRIKLYEPYGYIEELDYKSRKSKLDSDLEQSKENDKKEFSGLTQLFENSFTQIVYDSTNNQFLFQNFSGETKGIADMSEVLPHEIITDAYYDSDTNELVLVFKNGQEVRIPMDDIIDLDDFGDGLEVVSGTVKVKIDESGEPFLSVGEEGLKLSGVEDAIAAAVSGVISDVSERLEVEIERAKSAERTIQGNLDQESERAVTKENELAEAISGETSRATEREDELDARISELESGLTEETLAREEADEVINDKISDIEESISGLSKYVGDGKTIAVKDIAGGNDKEISTTISMLKVVTGLGVNVQEAYQLVDAEGTKIGDQINIYKDSSLLGVALVNSPAEWDPIERKIVGGTGETVLAFAYELADSGEIVITEIPISELVSEAVFKDGLQVGDNNEISVKIDDSSENFLTVSENGVRISGVQDAIDNAVSDRLSGVSVNGKAAVVTDNVADIKIAAVEEPYSGSTPNAIVVKTDDNGNVTIGIGAIDGGSY